MKFWNLAVLVVLSLHACPALAQAANEIEIDNIEPPGGSRAADFIAIGPGLIPKFDGSDKYQIVPFVVADVEWKGVELQVRGLGARVDVAGVFGDSDFRAGPAFNYRPKRDNEDGGPLVSRLDDVAAAFEAGGFVGYTLGGDETGSGAISVDLQLVADVSNGHGGWLATGQISYAAVRTKTFFLNADASATYGSKDYMRAYFGVSESQSAQSGLNRFSPGADIRDIGAGLTAGYQFDRRWGVIARMGANIYMGGAKDSPIVAEGSKIQGSLGLGLSYRF